MRRVRVKTFLRSFTHGRGQQRLQYFSVAVIGGFVFLGVFVFSLLGFGTLLGLEEGAALASLVLAGVYTFVALALVFVGLAAALYTMYLSGDIDVLSSMPIKERTIFAYKFWETLIGNSALFVVLALPMLLAYGISSGASVLFYPALLVVSVLILMVPTGASVLLTMPLMRILPAGKAKEIVGALGIVAATGFYVAQQWLLSPSRAEGTSTLRSLAEAPILNVPPGSWASEVLAGAALLEWGRLLGGLVPLAVLAFGVYAVCLGLTGWAYATGRARAAESGGRVRSSGWVGRLLAPLPRDIRAVAVKDLTSLPRDLRRLATLVFPAAMLIALFAINFPGLASAGRVSGLLLLGPYLTVSVFAILASFQSGAQAVSIEGRSYWLLAAMPLSPWRLLAGKLVATSFVGTVATLLGSLGLSVILGFYLPGFLLGVAAGVVGSAVGSLYSVGISAMFPRFDWENPNQATTTAGGFALLMCMLGFAVLAMLVTALAFAVSGFVPLPLSVAGAAVLWTAGAAIPGYAVFAAGTESLKRLDWEL